MIRSFEGRFDVRREEKENPNPVRKLILEIYYGSQICIIEIEVSFLEKYLYSLSLSTTTQYLYLPHLTMHNALQSFHRNFPDQKTKKRKKKEERSNNPRSIANARAKFHSRVRVLSDLSTLRTSSLCCPMHTQQRRRPEARYRLNPATFFFSPRPPLLDSFSPLPPPSLLCPVPPRLILIGQRV